MKRMMLVWVMMLCLVPLGGWAEEETTPALYPIRENGLWGYMNRAGEVVIEPQWLQAYPFTEEYALVGTFPLRNYGNVEGDGLIDRQGNWIIQPQENLRITESFCTWNLEIRNGDKYSVGFLDKKSGFCMMPDPEYIQLLNWYEDGSGPIPVMNTDEMIGFIDRTSGQVVIPFIYNELTEDIGFENGYSISASAGQNLTDEYGTEINFVLINDVGQKTEFPKGVYAFSGVNMDRLVICDARGFFGLARPDGTIIVEPKYEALSSPEDDGVISFLEKRDNRYYAGHMDLNGNVIVPAIYCLRTDENHAPYYDTYCFSGGYAVFVDVSSEHGSYDNGRTVILDVTGNEVLSLPCRLSDGKVMTFDGAVTAGYVMENGLIWYRICDTEQDRKQIQGDGVRYGLIRLKDDTYEFVGDAGFECPYGGVLKPELYDYSAAFCEGLHPVRQNGFWGYIDEDAQWVIPPQYDKAASFSDRLALVEKDGKLMYIDHSGAVVWEER